MLSPLASPLSGSPEDALPSRIPRILQDRVVGIVIASFFTVHRELGHGFVEAVYHRALALEFSHRGLRVEQNAALSVFYKGAKVGHHAAAFVVEGRVVVDLRATPRFDPLDERTLVSIVKASGCDAGVLLHFGQAALFRHVERETQAPGWPVLPSHPGSQS
jgi:GxxExxY protein